MTEREVLEIVRRILPAYPEAREVGLTEDLVMAVIEVESHYDENAVSPAGAEGLGQLTPITQRHTKCKDPFNPNENVRCVVKYLFELLTRFGTEVLALAAYNAGPGNVTKYNGIPPFKETQDYVPKVLKALKLRQNRKEPIA